MSQETPVTAGIARTVSAGYETIVDPDAVASLADELDATSADAVAISAGRADWATFQWVGHEDRWATTVDPDDPFESAVDQLGTDRRVVAVIDVFAGPYLEDNPDLASVDADGEPLDFQVSIAELTTGDHGDAIVEMAGALAARDDVDAINLTELHYDVGGFGPDDEELYAEDTGEDGWPEDDDGEIDVDDPKIGQWRSERVAQFVARVAEAVHEHGDELLVDVRAPRDGDGGTVKYGQDYDALLEHADRLVVWHYVALSNHDGSASDSAALLDELSAYGAERIIVSLGLWGDGDESLPAHQLDEELAAVKDSDLSATWITPASMLNDDHWAVLQQHWPR